MEDESPGELKMGMGVGVGDEGRMEVCSRITCGRPECELDFGR